MANESPREQSAERKEMQMAALRFDVSTARPLKEIVLHDLKCGTRPEYLAMKYASYGVTLERVLAAKAAIDKQQERKNDAAV